MPLDRRAAEEMVIRATGRAALADALAWIAEGRPRRGRVDDQSLMQALNQLGGRPNAERALKSVAQQALRSSIDPSLELLRTEEATTSAQLRAALDDISSYSPTGSLAGVTAETLAMAIRKNVLAVECLALVAGMSYRDLCDIAAIRHGTTLPSRAESDWTATQVSTAFMVIDAVVNSTTGAATLAGAKPAEPVEWLLDPARRHGWAAVADMAESGVPYEVLLAQRGVGGAWLAHRNSTSTAFGRAVGTLMFEALDAGGLTYRRRATSGDDGMSVADLASLVGAGKGSGHIAAVLPGSGEPKLVICSSVARDGGTARKSAGRLSQLPAEVSVPAAAVVFGPGWAARTESVELVHAFEGRVFTERSLDRLVSWAATTIQGNPKT